MSRTWRHGDSIWIDSRESLFLLRKIKQEGSVVESSPRELRTIQTKSVPLSVVYGRNYLDSKSRKSRYCKRFFNKRYRHKQNQLLKILGEEYSAGKEYAKDLLFEWGD